MQFKDNVVIIFFIENYYQEKLLMVNHLKDYYNSLALYSGIKPKEFKGKILETNAPCFELALPKILEQIEYKWIVYLKPEEKIIFFDNWENLKRPFYFINIKTLLNKDFYLDSYELRIFNRNRILSGDFEPKIDIDNTIDITINNYSNGFPELDRQKFNKSVQLFEKGDKRLSLLLYLAEKKYLNNLTITTCISNFRGEKSQSSELLGLYCILAKRYIQENELELAKNTLLNALDSFRNSLTVNFLLGETYFREKSYEQAAFYFKSSLDLQKSETYFRLYPLNIKEISAQTNYYISKIFLEKREFEKAREAAENSIFFEPENVAGKTLLAQIESELSKQNQLNEMDFSCQGCGNCCRNFYVNITDKDVNRILEKRSDLKFDDFAVFENMNKSKLNLSKDNYFIFNNGEEKLLTLKKKDNSKDCVFLAADNRCTINEFKPMVCKTWPFALRKFDEKVVWEISNRNFIKRLCAHKLVKNSYKEDDLKDVIVKFEKERAEFIDLVYKWNLKVTKQSNSNILQKENKLVNFLFSNNSNKVNEKKKVILNNLIEVLSNDPRIKLILDSPFASIYFPPIDNDLSIGLYIENSMVSQFFKEDNLENLKHKLKAESYINSILPVSTYNFLIDGIFLNLYIYPVKFLNNPIHHDSTVLYNPLAKEIHHKPSEFLLKIEIKKLEEKFQYFINQANIAIDKGDFKNSYSILNSTVNSILSSLIIWLNKCTFVFSEIPFLKYKTEDLCEFILSIRNFNLNYDEQIKFVRNLNDIFERNLKLANFIN